VSYTVQIVASNAFTITFGGRTERFEGFTRERGGDFVSTGPAKMWLWAGRKKLDRLGIFPAEHGRAAPRVNAFIRKAERQAKKQVHT
jgi:hypothetical protein